MSKTLLQLQFDEFQKHSQDMVVLADAELKEHHTLIEYDQWNQMEEEEYNGLLLDYILNYNGEDIDLMYWAGRLALSNEIDKSLHVVVLPLHPPSKADILGRDDLDMVMNELTHRYYNMHLVMCPECSCIEQFSDDKPKICKHCKAEYGENDAPDLFF